MAGKKQTRKRIIPISMKNIAEKPEVKLISVFDN